MIVPMGYLARLPAGRLAGVIERLWLVEEEGAGAEPHAICPDGRNEIVLHLGDPMWQREAEGDRLQPRFLLVGQMARAITVVPSGRISMLGARFAPGALRRCLLAPQGELTGRIVDAAEVWSRWTRETADRLSDAASASDRLTVLEEAIARLLRPEAETPRGIASAVARLEATGGRASIAALARDAGISRRQFERRFQDEVGLPPRLFGRIVKFQRAFQALGRENGAAIAARCGYADQAHMVREIRRFAGTTPTTLATLDDELMAFFRV